MFPSQFEIKGNRYSILLSGHDGIAGHGLGTGEGSGNLEMR